MPNSDDPVVLELPKPLEVLLLAPNPVVPVPEPKRLVPVVAVVDPNGPPAVVAGFAPKRPPAFVFEPKPVFVVWVWPNGVVVFEPKRPVPVLLLVPKPELVLLVPKPPKPVLVPNAPAWPLALPYLRPWA